MVEVIWSEDAVSDIDRIYAYYDQFSHRFAVKLIRSYYERIALLEDFPLLGRIVPEYAVESMRELVDERTRIVYEIAGADTIIVLRVFLTSQLLDFEY